MEGLIALIFLVIIFGIGGGIYFLPAIVAKVRNQKNFISILILNLFLGWSLIGWVVALVWAFKED